MVDPLVSIIMPAYNAEKYIDLSIKSVQEQTYSNWELLIIDDFSKDHTRDIITKYAEDIRIKPILLNQNSGIAHARNIGIKKSVGKYVAFLDSDDIWLGIKLHEQIEFMERTHSQFTYSYYSVINEKNNYIRLVNGTPETLEYRQLLKSNYIGLLTAVVSSEVIKRELMPNIPHEDYAMWLSILKKGYTATLVPKVLAKYRVQNNSRSSNKLKAIAWTWNIYRRNQHQKFFKSLYYFSYYALTGLRKHL
ncbi:glycosyltransferase family 2 protein [Latilactobacillus curvatus]|uniref:glycosyltransferase family 2 protein n=1 Tax=Latilactobacillus curvatus TaxID=28038 RepID=UPI00145F15C1|nr:glycosyltransferase family 2 protein [Latilactobacillus curvatus]